MYYIWYIEMIPFESQSILFYLLENILRGDS